MKNQTKDVLFNEKKSNLKKILTLIFLLSVTFIFSQKYTFKYVLDNKKANGFYDKVGEFRISLEASAPVLYIFKPNKNYFASINDYSKSEKHYFHYKKSKTKGEFFKYIGTISDVKEIDVIDNLNLSKVEDNDIGQIISLNLEFGRNNLYYIEKDVINLEFDKNKTLEMKNIPALEINSVDGILTMIYQNEIQINLPKKKKFVDESFIRNFTDCTTKYAAGYFEDVKNGKEKIIYTDCE